MAVLPLAGGNSALFSVKGKTALVTGASSGLGAHFAILLAREGANVVAAARREEKLAEVVAEIDNLRKESSDVGEAVALSLDVSAGEAAVRVAVAKAWEKFGRIDILVNNAGVFSGAPPLEEKESDFDTLFNINVKGAWLVAKLVAKKQVEDGKGGSIVNISSTAGNSGGVVAAGAASYSATKATLQQLTRNLALELGPHGIRVNTISPGLFPSEMTEGMIPGVQDFFATKNPIRKVGDTCHDLDGPLLLFASNAGAYITGANLTVDGGLGLSLKSFLDGGKSFGWKLQIVLPKLRLAN